MQKKKQGLQSATNLPKTAEQVKFESSWIAGSSENITKEPSMTVHTNTIVLSPSEPSTSAAAGSSSGASFTSTPSTSSFSDLQPSTSKAANIILPSSADNCEFHNDDFENIQAFDCQRPASFISAHRENINNRGIPGLDLVVNDSEKIKSKYINRSPAERYNDDYSTNSEEYKPPIDPPALPTFKTVNKRPMHDIMDLLDGPCRETRPEK